MTSETINNSFLEFTQLRSLRRRLLGIDFGDQRTGVSVSDDLWTLANPVEVITKNPIQRIHMLCKNFEVCGFVLGHPLNMDGTEGPQAKKVTNFARVLSEILKLPIILWDERLSTFDAWESLRDVNLSYIQKKIKIDKIASCLILQGFLEKIRSHL